MHLQLILWQSQSYFPLVGLQSFHVLRSALLDPRPVSSLEHSVMLTPLGNQTWQNIVIILKDYRSIL